MTTFRLLKEFELEARADGMPAALLAQRKKALADQLNALIQRKKELGQAATKDELLAGAAVHQEANLEGEGCCCSAHARLLPALALIAPARSPCACVGADMSVQQLMHKGRRDLADTDATLNRAERLVEDTMQTGTQVCGEGRGRGEARTWASSIFLSIIPLSLLTATPLVLQTAAALHDQTEQLNKVVDDLNDIEFNVKKASKVIRDITRGLLTDK